MLLGQTKGGFALDGLTLLGFGAGCGFSSTGFSITSSGFSSSFCVSSCIVSGIGSSLGSSLSISFTTTSVIY